MGFLVAIAWIMAITEAAINVVAGPFYVSFPFNLHLVAVVHTPSSLWMFAYISSY
jgi:hypothetical protein